MGAQCEHFLETSVASDALFGQGPAFERLCEKLADDLRYQRLACVPSLRRRLVVARLEEVAADRKLGSRAQASEFSSEG